MSKVKKTKRPALNWGEPLVLSMVQAAIWNKPVPDDVEAGQWQDVYELATRHAIEPLLWAAVQKNAEKLNVLGEVREQLRARTIASVLAQERILKLQRQALALLSKAGIQSVIHKGASVARLYPAPYLRTMGDIDILVKEENYQQAVQVLADAGYQKSDKEHWYHVLLFMDGVAIEIHRAVARSPMGEAGAQLEKLMADAVGNAVPAVYNGEQFLVMSPKHQAIALLMHMQKHMTSNGIGLRQLCDWMMFVSATNEKDLQDIINAERSIGLNGFSQILTWTCVRFLGLGSEKAWYGAPNEGLCCLAIEDVMRGGNVTGGRKKSNYSSLFLEDVGHFESPFRGVYRTAHIFLQNINKKTIREYPKTSRVVVIRPVLWAVLGIAYIKKHRRDEIFSYQRKIARDRKRLYDAANFFHQK